LLGVFHNIAVYPYSNESIAVTGDIEVEDIAAPAIAFKCD
jgi:hypothetical protein